MREKCLARHGLLACNLVPFRDVRECFASTARFQLALDPLIPNPPSVPVAEAMPVLAPLCSVQDGDVLVMSATEPFDYRRVVSDMVVVLSKFSATGKSAGGGSREPV